jgi:hypothetical protein
LFLKLKHLSLQANGFGPDQSQATGKYFLPYTYIGVHAPIPVHIGCIGPDGQSMVLGQQSRSLYDRHIIDLVDSASDFGTIVESEQEIIFGELIDDEPVTPTILTDSTNR